MDFSNLWKHCYRVQTHSCFFPQITNVRGLPLSACHRLAALPAKICAFNSLMQQNACYRNLKWTVAGLLPRYCYAVKTNSRTIRSRLSQPASAGKGRDNKWTPRPSLHDTITVNLTLVQCVSCRQKNCHCKNQIN